MGGFSCGRVLVCGGGVGGGGCGWVGGGRNCLLFTCAAVLRFTAPCVLYLVFTAIFLLNTSFTFIFFFFLVIAYQSLLFLSTAYFKIIRVFISLLLGISIKNIVVKILRAKQVT